MAKGKKRGGKAGRVQNVRVVDEFAGADGARLDRMLSDLQNSQSQTRVLCSDCYTIGTTAAVQNANISASQVAVTDDFVSLISQYETFRVRAIQFDIYDVNPNLSAVGFFGTFHDNFTSTNQPVFIAANVVDSVDGQLVPPGTGKLSLTWMAHGSLEMGFNATINPIRDFGGLRYSIQAASGVAPKFQVYFKAIVDFRGKT